MNGIDCQMDTFIIILQTKTYINVRENRRDNLE